MIAPKILIRATLCLAFLFAASLSLRASADEKEDLQKALNAQVMASAFNAGDVKKAQAEAELSKSQGVVPVAISPTYWAPGWTCASLTAYRYYNYGDYRNCVYYHYYYHRYWQ